MDTHREHNAKLCELGRRSGASCAPGRAALALPRAAELLRSFGAPGRGFVVDEPLEAFKAAIDLRLFHASLTSHYNRAHYHVHLELKADTAWFLVH